MVYPYTPKKTKAPAVAKGKKKGIKKAKKKIVEPTSEKKKTPAPPKDDFKLMTLDEIESMFDLKNQAFEKRLKEYFKIKVQPLTLKLICKHAFLQKPRNLEPIEEEKKTEEAPTEEST